MLMTILNLKSSHPIHKLGNSEIYFGNDPENKYSEILLKYVEKKPTSQDLQKAWKDRQKFRNIPLIALLIFNNKAYLCGPSGEKPPIYNNIDIGQIERLCNSALQEPDRHSSHRLLLNFLPTLDDELAGIRNEGFLATHELKYGIQTRKDWGKSCKKANSLLDENTENYLNLLNFEIENKDNVTKYLRHKDRKRAIGILLSAGTPIDINNGDFANQSPVTYGMSIAYQENLPYLIIQSGHLLRIYPTDSSKAIGRRGRTETYIDVDTSIISNKNSGILWLIFSAEALSQKGSLAELISNSKRFGNELSGNLRKRIYDNVIPALAKGITEGKKLKKPSKDDLDTVYQIALTILFRLLFIAYAEDRDLLPYKTNEEYRRNSLQTIANSFLKKSNETDIEDESDSYWQEVKQLFKAVDQGNKAWSVPAYNGGLFSTKPEFSRFGYEVESLVLTNTTMLPVLQNLLLSEGAEGVQPVDFRSLSVREFGSIYEALLESELVFAKEDLVVDKKTGHYRPAKDNEEPFVPKNEIYTQNTSGIRKETASYYTKTFAVDHLLNRSLVPVLENHFKRLNGMDDQDAAKNFFDIKVADIAMGSGHFLVAAIDIIEIGLENYRNQRLLPEVSAELQKLRTASKKILGEFGEQYEIEDAQLIRRLIAKRCIFGVDLNPMAVELARLSIWIHTFVPGLPLSFLDRNLVVGNSLTGIGTLDEIKEIIEKIDNDGPQIQNLFPIDTESILGDARKHLAKLAKISEATIDDIEREKKAWKKAKEAIAPATALCDIISGTRINKTRFPIEILDDWDQHKINLENSKFRSEAMEGMNTENLLHFPTTFPEVFLRERSGFDVIIGNPPWEEAMCDEDEFWGRYIPGFHGLHQREREKMLPVFRNKNSDLEQVFESEKIRMEIIRKVLRTGPFPGIGKGHPDLYKAFFWRFWHLSVQDKGFIGVVLPRSVLSAKGSEIFRKKILYEADLVDATTLLNTGKWVFDMEARYTIVLLVIAKHINPNPQVRLCGPFNGLENFNKGVKKNSARFLGEEILSWTEPAIFPLLPTSESAALLIQLRKAPSLSLNKSGEWQARPLQGDLNATWGKPLMKFSKSCPEGHWPVYTGKSFNLWEPDTKQLYAFADPNVLIPHLQEKRLNSSKKSSSVFSKFSPQWIMDEKTLPCLSPRIAFRDISRATDTRTLRCALIPPNVFITNKGPYLLFPKGSTSDITFVLGILSSIPLDWWARRFVETSVNFFILNFFPIPRPDRKNLMRQRVVELAGRLACIDDRYADWAKELGMEYGLLNPEEKKDMIIELDAVVAHLYGLSEDQLAHIYETFHVGWDYQDRLDATLEQFNQWSQKV